MTAGLFAQQGIEPQLVVIRGSDKAVQALVGGSGYVSMSAPDAPMAEIHLDLYTGADEASASALFYEAARGTPAEHVALIMKQCWSRYICWNCCGLVTKPGSFSFENPIALSASWK